MKEAFIVAKVPKKPHYYPSGKQMPNIPDLLKRQFDQDRLNTHWVGDITYIRNHKRLNSAIDYLTPVQKRQELLKVA